MLRQRLLKFNCEVDLDGIRRQTPAATWQEVVRHFAALIARAARTESSSTREEEVRGEDSQH
jgi:hypothetical protein